MQEKFDLIKIETPSDSLREIHKKAARYLLNLSYPDERQQVEEELENSSSETFKIVAVLRVQLEELVEAKRRRDDFKKPHSELIRDWAEASRRFEANPPKFPGSDLLDDSPIDTET